MTRRMGPLLVAVYLVAIATANLLAAAYGRAHPWVLIANALALIGLDLTTRDALHDRWTGRGWPWRMTALIAIGGLVSWLANPDAGQIAVASTVAFLLASGVDVTVYQLARRRRWMLRVNLSNLAAAAVDSLVFPTLAFGAVNWRLTMWLFAAKVVGGAGWAWLLARIRGRWLVAAVGD